jgi:hypothetical protein
MYYVNSLKQTTVQEKVYMSSCCSTQTHYICSYSLMICTFVVELQQSPILNYFAFKYIGFERTWWRLFIYWFWAYMMKVIHILILSVHDEGYSYIGFERTWWRLFIYWFWAYMMKVIHILVLSVHDEGYSYIGFERTWWRLFILQTRHMH